MIKEEIRLNKYLSSAGVCSRREADRLIEEGDVTVNGQRAMMGMKISAEDKVQVRGQEIKELPDPVILLMNKPKGIICTTQKREKPNIIQFLNYGERIYPVGRLDKESEGLLLLTNQGDLVNRIMRAGNYHEKEYLVEVDKEITEAFLHRMAAGVAILDTVTRPCQVEKVDGVHFRIILTQGLNRQIRRMCTVLGYQVLSLQRVRIMNLELGELPSGGYRKITDEEYRVLEKLLSDSDSRPWKERQDEQ